MDKVNFSIVTATFNRASLIDRVFTSLEQQTFRNFEWIIIDDGSTDNTESIVEDYSKRSAFKLIYVKTQNKGKAHALNTSLQYCSGSLYLVFDSDDWCDPDALAVLHEEYVKLKNRDDFTDYCALSCLKRYQSKHCVGDTYNSLSKYGLTYIDRINKEVKGDKWECLFFNKLKDLKYPICNDDKYMAPGFIWLLLAEQGNKTVFINKELSTVEYQLDGISKNNFRNRYNSRLTTAVYYEQAFQLKGLSFKAKARYYINYIRFSFHAKSSKKFSPSCFLFFPLAFLMYVIDTTVLSREN